MKSNASLSTVNCPWKKLLTLVSVVWFGAALLAPQPAAAQAAAVEAIIIGAGRADTASVSTIPHLSNIRFILQATLKSDGSADGFFSFIQPNNDSFSNFNTEFTSWKVLLEGTYVLRGPFVNGAEVIMYIEEFGGPGVGRWTMYKPMFDGFTHTFITLDATVGTGRISLH